MAVRLPGWLNLRRGWKWAAPAAWAITMVGLPLTTFPLIYNLTGATVAPFSAIPLIGLFLIWFVPYLLHRGKVPREAVPFLVFALLLVGLAAYAFFEVGDYFRHKPLLSQTLRSFLPFGLGLAFFLVTSTWQRESAALRRTLQWIHVGGFLLLLYSAAEAVVVFELDYQFPPFLDAIRNALAAQPNLVATVRLAGLTWEPSWFAHQLNMLYLPLWLAATFQRTSVFPKIWKISFENIFLLGGVVVFFLASPRIGAAGCMLMLLYLFVKLNLGIYRWIIRRLAPLWAKYAHPRILKFGVGLALVLAMVATYGGFSFGLFKIVSERDWRVNKIVTSQFSAEDVQQIMAFDENTLFLLGKRFAFLERTVYWMTGWRIFNDYPFLGVGLGNAGYYFPRYLPDIGWASTEISSIFYLNDSLPNTKSMWYRLLAETGIVGFSLFATWLIGLWSSASRSLRSLDPTLKTVALAGQLALLAYIFEGLSVDSFGLPYLFVMAGLIASAGFIYRQTPLAKFEKQS